MRAWHSRLTIATLAAGVTVIGAEAPQADSRIEHVVSPGGIEAYLVPEPSIPILAVALYFRGGASLDPEGREGLAYMVSGLLDEGAGELDSRAFRGELEDKAIRLSFDAERDGFSVTLRTLTEHRERAFEMLAMALTEPRFDPEPVDRVRSQIRSQLARRAEDPNRMAMDAWLDAAFPDHPYGRPLIGTPESIAAIDEQDLRTFVAERFARDNLIIGVAGDITADELALLLDATFGALPDHASPWQLEDTAPRATGMQIIRRPLPQSVVVFGHQGVARLDPDYYPAYVANHILGGGGFGSRLTEEVRERRGLAYSVYSYLQPMQHAASWLGSVATANEQVGEALAVIRREIERFQAGDISEADLEDAKTYLTGSFPLRLTTNHGIANLLVGIQIHDLGLDFIDRRNDYIEAVTLEDVRRVASALFDAERLLLVVVGDPAGLEG